MNPVQTFDVIPPFHGTVIAGDKLLGTVDTSISGPVPPDTWMKLQFRFHFENANATDTCEINFFLRDEAATEHLILGVSLDASQQAAGILDAWVVIRETTLGQWASFFDWTFGDESEINLNFPAGTLNRGNLDVIIRTDIDSQALKVAPTEVLFYRPATAP